MRRSDNKANFFLGIKTGLQLNLTQDTIHNGFGRRKLYYSRSYRQLIKQLFTHTNYK